MVFSNIMAQVEKNFGQTLLEPQKPFGACVLNEEIKMDVPSLALVCDKSMTISDRLKVTFEYFE